MLLCHLWQRLKLSERSYRVWLSDNLLIVLIMLVADAMYRVVLWHFGLAAGMAYRHEMLASVFATVMVSGLIMLSVGYLASVWRGWRSCRKLGAAFLQAPEAIARYFTGRRVANLLICLALMFAFGYRFLLVKALIPFVHPYSWDNTFKHWDEWLFGGHDVYTLLLPYLSVGTMRIFDMLYNQWFFIMVGVNMWLAMYDDQQLRKAYYLAYALAWIGMGLGMAFWLSSCGPAFYNKLLGHHHWTFLMMNKFNAFFNDQQMLPSFIIQGRLVDNVLHHRLNMMSGISAMPSLHMGMIMLWLLALRRGNQVVWQLLFIYNFLMLWGIVALGWHYLVDGLVAWAVTALIWLLSRLVVRRSGL